MNSKIKIGIAFLAGAISGAGGMFAFIKLKWQKDFEAKREEMIQYFEKKESKNIDERKEDEYSDLNEDRDRLQVKASQIIKQYNYSRSSVSSNEITKNQSPILNDSDYNNEPYEIDSRSFGSQEMYGMVTLYLYDDGEMRTEKHELLDDDDIDNYIGLKTLERLADERDADPELDCMYIRNDRLKTDYEILIESGRYEE